MITARTLAAATIAAGVALTGIVGVGIGVAGAAGPADIAATKHTPTPQPVPGVTLNHHDQKKLDKYLKKHPDIAVPNTGAH